jgi:hypothetical protein
MKCVETASGCAKQKEASGFMAKLERHSMLKAGLNVRGHGFAPKSSNPALSAADFLCWEWQRNYIENPTLNLVRSEFRILISPNPTEIYIQPLTKNQLSSQALTNRFHGVCLWFMRMARPAVNASGPETYISVEMRTASAIMAA